MDHVLRLESQLPTIEHESAISFSFTQSSSSIPTASSPPDSIFVHGSNSAPLDYNFLSSSSPSIPTPKSCNFIFLNPQYFFALYFCFTCKRAFMQVIY